jgi:hypothetical protein
MIDDRRIENNKKAPHGRDSQATLSLSGSNRCGSLFGPPADSKNACASFCVWKSEQSRSGYNNPFLDCFGGSNLRASSFSAHHFNPGEAVDKGNGGGDSRSRLRQYRHHRPQRVLHHGCLTLGSFFFFSVSNDKIECPDMA